MPRRPSSASRRTPCTACPLQSLRAFRPFEKAEVAFLDGFKTGELIADAGATILLEGASSPHLYTVLSGWAFRFKLLPDGRRQILNFALPGDFLGLQGQLFGEMQHSVQALTRIVLCVFPREKLWQLYERHPELAYDLTWIVSRSERILDENLLSVGRRSALERIAHVLLHIFHRASELKMTDGRHVTLPFTQQHVADALGLSLVHTNKTLRVLGDRKLIRWKDGVLEIIDLEALSSIASYDTEPRRPRPLL